jgi:hypothetical protein
MARESTKEIQDKLIANMKRWQKIENTAVAQTGAIMDKSDNAVIKLIMEIIQRDSQMHHRVQQLIVDTLESATVTLNPDDLAQVWTQIEGHIQTERETVALAKDSLAAIEGRKGMLIQGYLLNFLKMDEQKHDMLLESLEKIKKGMYPYG